MRVLGIHDGHNATAALITDGSVEYAIQEERLNGVKNFWGFPEAAVAEILQRSRMEVRDVDHVALASEDVPTVADRERWVRDLKRVHAIGGASTRALWSAAGYRLRRGLRRRLRLLPLLRLGFAPERISFVDHHRAHAMAAYLGSPWRSNVLVLTCDGSGDGLAATLNVGRGPQLRRIAAVDASHSLGMVYALTTSYLGMTPNEDEYKVMGLAPYAPESASADVYGVFKSLFGASQEGLGWKRRRGVPDTHHLLPHLRRHLANRRFDHVCGGLQRWTQELLAEWVRNCIRRTGIGRVALGGGVFMNVKANKVIGELPEVEDLFVFPSCGDESTAVGAAWAAYSALAPAMKDPPPPVAPVEGIYWGTEFGDDEIGRELQRRRFRQRHCADVEAEVAELLTRGEVVARFKGRLEFGARALGNRSILADPSNPRVVRTINRVIKGRDFWMPFACSILDDCERQYVRNPKGFRSPYMMMTYDTTSRVDHIVAGTHAEDGTVRPQIVYRELNDHYHHLIREFARRTQIGAVLNTSFNLHGSPIVGSPAAALDVLEHSGLRWLAIGNFMVEKS